MPIVENWPATYEDDEVANGEDDRSRTFHFGWPDHLRF
jgi:hypothetical protein